MGGKICEICGKIKAKYICQECSRDVCEMCLETGTLLCSECYRKNIDILRRESMLFNSPYMKIFLLGFLLILIGIIVLVITSLASGLTFLGFLLIGPIPIIFGAGQDFFWMLLLGIILTILSIVLFFVIRRQQ